MIAHAVHILNEAFAADPAAMHALLVNRVPCNAQLADHPTIVVEPVDLKGKECYTLGLIGLLNGIFSTEGAVIASCWSDDTPSELVGFLMREQKDFNLPEP